MAYQVLKENTNGSAEDPEDTFGRHVANQLRDMEDKRTRDYVKLKIQQLLYDIQYGGFSMPYNASTPHSLSYKLQTRNVPHILQSGKQSDQSETYMNLLNDDYYSTFLLTNS